MNQRKITIGTVCFLINKSENKVLLLERYNEPMKGMFTGVGGKTNFDEDINASCIREIKEETGLNASNLKLKGVIKTLLEPKDSSWILFIYTTSDFDGTLIDCPEGNLVWINTDEVFNVNLIGFIREILPNVLNEDIVIEGTILHDNKGNVLNKNMVFVG